MYFSQVLVGSGGAAGGCVSGGATFKYWMQVHVFPPVKKY